MAPKGKKSVSRRVSATPSVHNSASVTSQKRVSPDPFAASPSVTTVPKPLNDPDITTLDKTVNGGKRRRLQRRDSDDKVERIIADKLSPRFEIAMIEGV